MLDADNLRFLQERTAPVPREWGESIERKYRAGIANALKLPAGTGRQSEAVRNQNLWLARITARAAQAWIAPGATDAEIRELASLKAREFWQLAQVLHDPAALRARMAARCQQLGIMPPGEAVADMPAIRRMTADGWWRRKIRRTQGALIEEIAIALGYVHCRRQPYCSDETVKRRQAQIRRNALTLEATELENQYSYSATVAELAARSVSNPRIKHAELMTRSSGFDSLARSMGYVGMFITATCPSPFHAVLESGKRNPKHDGSTPRDAQRHLVKAWARCRAALHRRHVRPFGFRVAEPHHDGCPHWHMLLFVAPERVDTLRNMFLRYFLEQHNPDETGARKNRVKFVEIDPERGSATGYIAKYISKSIDGEHIDADDYGNSGKAAAQRVIAWAAAHGIRQFQQIGGAPVTVWRELRRLEADAAHPEEIAAARSAADAGNWERYIEVQGGPTVARDDLAITLARTAEGERLDPDTGETISTLNQYGEPAAPAIFGVSAAASGKTVLTRRYLWTPRRSSVRERGPNVAPNRRASPWRAQRDSSKAEGRAAWTRVNNCTGTAAEPAAPAPSHLSETDTADPSRRHPAPPPPAPPPGALP